MNVTQDWDWDSGVPPVGTGSASFSLHSAAPTAKLRERWMREDEARDRRRTVPFGFQAPLPAVVRKGKRKR